MDKSNYGKLKFQSSISELNAGFKWAKKQALAYVHNGEDAVGLWYEASLPARDAFCMRDTAHHAAGAAALGLAAHTKNMLFQFAASIREERDWCGYWEITKDGLPCPEDYISDKDFWYNFPGSFEVIIACWQEYLRTGDEDYLTDPVFNYFYEQTCTVFVEYWDRDRDGILEHYPEYGRRGIASYNECDTAILTAADMLACQWAAYGAYSEILLRQGRQAEAASIRTKQEMLKQKYLTQWYSRQLDGFYGAMLADGSFYPKYYKEGNFLPIYFGILSGEDKLKKAHAQIINNPPDNVEGMSYMPQVFYTCADEERGLGCLIALGSEDLLRREYPEVSFAYIGSVAGCVMGIAAGEGTVTTRSGLPEQETAALENVPVFNGVIDVRHDAKTLTALTNRTGTDISWKAVFAGICREIYVDEISVPFETGMDEAGKQISYLLINTASMQGRTVRVVR